MRILAAGTILAFVSANSEGINMTTASLSIHDVRKIEARPIDFYPAGESISYPWVSRHLAITDKDGSTIELVLFGRVASDLLLPGEDDPGVLADKGDTAKLPEIEVPF